MIIRHAQLSDIDRCVEMAVHFIEGTAYSLILKASRVQLSQLAAGLIEHGVIFVSETETDPGETPEVVGMMGLFLVTHPVSGSLVASEIAFWLEPTHRGGSTWKRLKSAGERWAKENGAIGMNMIAPAGSIIAEFYRRDGYTKVEECFYKEL